MNLMRYTTDKRELTESEQAEREETRQKYMESFQLVIRGAKKDLKNLRAIPVTKDNKKEHNFKIDYLLDVMSAAKKDLKHCREHPPITTIIEQIRIGPEHPGYEHAWLRPMFASRCPIRAGHEPPAAQPAESPQDNHE